MFPFYGESSHFPSTFSEESCAFVKIWWSTAAIGGTSFLHILSYFYTILLCWHVNNRVLDIFWIWTGSPRIICDGEGFPDLLRLPGSLDRRVLTVCPCPVWFSPKSCALWIPLVPLLQVLAQDHWQEVRLERNFWFSSAPKWQSVTLYTTHSNTFNHLTCYRCCSVAAGFVVTCHYGYYGFLGHHTWQVLISPAALLHIYIYILNHLDLFSTCFSCTRYSTPSVEAVRRSRKSSCDLDSFDTRE